MCDEVIVDPGAHRTSRDVRRFAGRWTLSPDNPIPAVEPHILHQLVTMKQSSATHVYDSFEPLSET
jgi:hypothetical protein